MGLSLKSNYRFFFVSCFDIGEVPRSPGKWNWNWLYFLPFTFTFEQCVHRPPSQNSTDVDFVKIMSDYDLVILIKDLQDNSTQKY